VVRDAAAVHVVGEHAEDDVDVAVAAVLSTDIATERCVTTKAVPSGRDPRRMLEVPLEI
jgi:hypothetical protein